MNFCPQCRNMYYTKLDEDELKYYCRNCGHTDDKMDASRICEVFHTQLKRSETYSHVVNEYTVFDPTLPRVLNMQCPACTTKEGSPIAASASNEGSPMAASNEGLPMAMSSNVSVKREIICVRYDDKFMKYVYICTHCNTSWKT
jgi:DNA-directed RNA polymerase subunit M/transcription elongation factor TFIIS